MSYYSYDDNKRKKEIKLKKSSPKKEYFKTELYFIFPVMFFIFYFYIFVFFYFKILFFIEFCYLSDCL